MSDIVPVPQHFHRNQGETHLYGTVPLGDWSEEDFIPHDQPQSFEQFVEGAVRDVNWRGLDDPKPPRVKRKYTKRVK